MPIPANMSVADMSLADMCTGATEAPFASDPFGAQVPLHMHTLRMPQYTRDPQLCCPTLPLCDVQDVFSMSGSLGKMSGRSLEDMMMGMSMDSTMEG